jgi:NAD(P)H-hydrate epimerase
MSTGGMGDVLTGVCAALIGQHLAPYDAARTGAWLCGRAAENAFPDMVEESLTAMDVAHNLCWAFHHLRAGTL